MFVGTITEAVDSVKFILQDVREDKRFIRKKILQACTGDTLHHYERAHSYARSEKNSITSYESAITLKVIYCNAVVNLHIERLDLFWPKIVPLADLMQSELTITNGRAQERRFHN